LQRKRHAPFELTLPARIVVRPARQILPGVHDARPPRRGMRSFKLKRGTEVSR
jgi:hypothetical protein